MSEILCTHFFEHNLTWGQVTSADFQHLSKNIKIIAIDLLIWYMISMLPHFFPIHSNLFHPDRTISSKVIVLGHELTCFQILSHRHHLLTVHKRKWLPGDREPEVLSRSEWL